MRTLVPGVDACMKSHVTGTGGLLNENGCVKVS
jgi:hypothetical protein